MHSSRTVEFFLLLGVEHPSWPMPIHTTFRQRELMDERLDISSKAISRGDVRPFKSDSSRSTVSVQS